jgi:hypothetical protein
MGEILEELRFLDLEFLVGEQPFVMEKALLVSALQVPLQRP